MTILRKTKSEIYIKYNQSSWIQFDGVKTTFKEGTFSTDQSLVSSDSVHKVEHSEE
jgi:hypothetical protein